MRGMHVYIGGVLLGAILGLGILGGISALEKGEPAQRGHRPQATLAPSCRPTSMGASQRCAPGSQFRFAPTLAMPTGVPCIDLSNNNPAFGASAWKRIRAHAVCAVFKVSEGTGFIDQTAARMAAEARKAGLVVGGYDFQHVCGASPMAEASTFIAAARRAGLLTGVGVLPPTADFESGSGCAARTWLATWTRTVRKAAGRAMVYSDPGFYVPSVGCFHDADVGWVADLGGFQVLCSLPTRLHQWSWTYWDGVAAVDGDVFRGSLKELQALANVKPVDHRPRSQLEGRRRALRRVLLSYGCRRRTRQHERLGPRCRRWYREGAEVNGLLKNATS